MSSQILRYKYTYIYIVVYIIYIHVSIYYIYMYHTSIYLSVYLSIYIYICIYIYMYVLHVEREEHNKCSDIMTKCSRTYVFRSNYICGYCYVKTTALLKVWNLTFEMFDMSFFILQYLDVLYTLFVFVVFYIYKQCVQNV